MKRPDSFPYEYKAGGKVFQIYLAPLSRTGKDGKTTKYESFLVKHTQGADLAQKRRSTWEAVETFIEDVVAAHRKNDPESLKLAGRDRRIYLAAMELATPLGREVDDLVREHVAATRLLAPHGLDVPRGSQILEAALTKLEKVPLSTAVDFYKRHGATMTGTRTVPQVVEELLKELELDKRGDYHVRDMRLRLGRFASAFPGPIHHLQERDITGWLQMLKKTVWTKKEEKREEDGKKTRTKAKRIESPEGDLVGERTRNNYRDAVNQLFEFAKRRGYVPRDLPTAAEDTARVKVVAGKNHIISSEEAKRALGNLPPYLIPFTVLKLFSGLRTEEAYGLCWDELRFKSNAVIIEAKLAKLRQRRVPPILPNLAKWLRPFRHLKGPINPRYSSPAGVMKAVNRESKKVNVILGRNTFRNCYISYRVAQPQHSTTVAAEAGTSVRMVESNYKELATKEEAKRWFSICPTRSQLANLESFVKTL
jgi:integrase